MYRQGLIDEELASRSLPVKNVLLLPPLARRRSHLDGRVHLRISSSALGCEYKPIAQVLFHGSSVTAGNHLEFGNQPGDNHTGTATIIHTN